jgi:LacI family transcriptional regulator
MALPEPPEAILAGNNLIAIGVFQVLDELGDRSIGLSVIGDLPFATSRPPILSGCQARVRDVLRQYVDITMSAGRAA